MAAGNSGTDACYGSPSSSEDAVTVMASDQYDTAAYYSDYGQCCDLYAPGSTITSASTSRMIPSLPLFHA